MRDAGYTRSREDCPLYYARRITKGGMIYKRDNWKCHEWLHAGSYGDARNFQLGCVL